MYVCGGSAVLGALAVMSLINKIRGRGRYVISIYSFAFCNTTFIHTV